MMSAADVLAVTSRLAAAGIPFWLDGGWGVDALIGEQTRPHADLDIVVPLDAADGLIATLSEDAFAVITDERPTRLVLEAPDGRKIDIHPVVFDDTGNARQVGAGPNGGDAPYPAAGFAGRGLIGGAETPCLTPELLLMHHQGYRPLAKDWHNVRFLCARFALKVPAAYEMFIEGHETG